MRKATIFTRNESTLVSEKGYLFLRLLIIVVTLQRLSCPRSWCLNKTHSRSFNSSCCFRMLTSQVFFALHASRLTSHSTSLCSCSKTNLSYGCSGDWGLGSIGVEAEALVLDFTYKRSTQFNLLNNSLQNPGHFDKNSFQFETKLRLLIQSNLYITATLETWGNGRLIQVAA